MSTSLFLSHRNMCYSWSFRLCQSDCGQLQFHHLLLRVIWGSSRSELWKPTHPTVRVQNMIAPSLLMAYVSKWGHIFQHRWHPLTDPSYLFQIHIWGSPVCGLGGRRCAGDWWDLDVPGLQGDDARAGRTVCSLITTPVSLHTWPTTLFSSKPNMIYFHDSNQSHEKGLGCIYSSLQFITQQYKYLLSYSFYLHRTAFYRP